MDKRPRLQRIFMDFALAISLRSTCHRAQVGTVIASSDLTSILSYGYNGVAKGLPNGCLRNIPGSCGCLHSEDNAITKLKTGEPSVMFITLAPCETCQQRIMNLNVKLVYYYKEYRNPVSSWFNIPIFNLNSLTDNMLDLHLKQLRNREYVI